MKSRKQGSIKNKNWRKILTNKIVIWSAAVLILLVVISNANVRNLFKATPSRAMNWSPPIQMTKDAGFTWALDTSPKRVLVAKGNELGKPINLYIYNAEMLQQPPLKVLDTDIVGGDPYLASARINNRLVVYARERADKQGSTLWVYSINTDDISGVNIQISPEDSNPSSKRYRVRPDISGFDTNTAKIIYQDYDISGGGQIKRGDLMMVDTKYLATPVLVAPKIAIIGDHWEYEDPAASTSPKIDNWRIVWRDLIGDDISSVQNAVYATTIQNPDSKTTLLAPAYYPVVGNFDINGGLAVASISTKGVGGKINTNIFYCSIDKCMTTLKLVNTKNTYPYVATQASLAFGFRVLYMVEKPKSDTNSAPVHQQWRYHDTGTGEDILLTELGSASNTTLITAHYERPMWAIFGSGPKMAGVVTKRDAPGGIPSSTAANIFASLGL